MYPMSSGFSSASSRANLIASATPFSSGFVKLVASQLEPKPAISPSTGTFRFWADSNDSSTNTAAPSASTKPLRFLSKGLQAVSGVPLCLRESTPNASQARRSP